MSAEIRKLKLMSRGIGRIFKQVAGKLLMTLPRILARGFCVKECPRALQRGKVGGIGVCLNCKFTPQPPAHAPCKWYFMLYLWQLESINLSHLQWVGLNCTQSGFHAIFLCKDMKLSCILIFLFLLTGSLWQKKCIMIRLSRTGCLVNFNIYKYWTQTKMAVCQAPGGLVSLWTCFSTQIIITTL